MFLKTSTYILIYFSDMTAEVFSDNTIWCCKLFILSNTSQLCYPDTISGKQSNIKHT